MAIGQSTQLRAHRPTPAIDCYTLALVHSTYIMTVNIFVRLSKYQNWFSPCLRIHSGWVWPFGSTLLEEKKNSISLFALNYHIRSLCYGQANSPFHSPRKSKCSRSPHSRISLSWICKRYKNRILFFIPSTVQSERPYTLNAADMTINLFNKNRIKIIMQRNSNAQQTDL